ncbi:YihY/virulence factor BrkB family protein [Polymorphobacter fuscus]|uniref:Ribonuclease BN n=1 Tax=Sandarakinorhabdus fusca TaxID=1439888 RepID=A0A7C9KKT9_9SPHN|nr:YihY/virulence factor BrkB family protein [Polymorphobacter fuscus]KAB7647466.1 YihY/virulence factor BrkB family protein [Polymorphobacter fuscus]MQT16723.1 ribonuclease BN [Polymorphobacter fuscus]NJC09290.1 membrane protein [Polymorphobacter fuscus]
MFARSDPVPRLVSRLLVRHRRTWTVVRETVTGVWADGFTHAGNLAYLSLLTLFPFFIVLATVAGTIGRTDYGSQALRGFMRLLPPDVAELVAKPIADVTEVRASAGLLTFGILVTLWTVTTFIETIRDIIRRAYGTKSVVPVWQYRIASLAFVFAACFLMLLAFAAQVVLTGAETFIARLMPQAETIIAEIGFRRLLPAVALFTALYAIFYTLTPKRFRGDGFRIWPGALVTMVTWVGTTMVMPWALALAGGGYSLTYGSLAGVIVALLFFYIIGMGLVAGAHLNAALAKARQRRLKTAETLAGPNGAQWPES